jgi:hypothetical protein
MSCANFRAQLRSWQKIGCPRRYASLVEMRIERGAHLAREHVASSQIEDKSSAPAPETTRARAKGRTSAMAWSIVPPICSQHRIDAMEA